MLRALLPFLLFSAALSASPLTDSVPFHENGKASENLGLSVVSGSIGKFSATHLSSPAGDDVLVAELNTRTRNWSEAKQACDTFRPCKNCDVHWRLPTQWEHKYLMYTGAVESIVDFGTRERPSERQLVWGRYDLERNNDFYLKNSSNVFILALELPFPRYSLDEGATFFKLAINKLILNHPFRFTLAKPPRNFWRYIRILGELQRGISAFCITGEFFGSDDVTFFDSGDDVSEFENGGLSKPFSGSGPFY